jgi:cytidylate kinase
MHRITESCTKVTISGEIGSGKSTVSEFLASNLGTKRLSTGAIQREMAAERGIGLLDFNLLSEHNPDLDAEIDKHTAALHGSPEPIVVDSRMAWYFLPESVKVLLIVDPAIAAARVIGDSRRVGSEDHRDLAAAKADIIARRESEVKRFKALYGVDCSDFRNFDLVIDTSFATPLEVVSAIEHYISNDCGKPRECWLAPKRLFPTQHVRGLLPDSEQGTSANGGVEQMSSAAPIQVVSFNEWFFILDGHKRTGAALRGRLPFIKAEISHTQADEVLPGLSVAEYLRDHCHQSWIHDWEDCYGFRFFEYPEAVCQ